jgi:hypothetical protein
VKRLQFVATWILVGALGAIVLLYGGDYVYIRHKKNHPETGPALGTVNIQPIIAVPQKSGKEEYYLGDPETDSCVHSIFPHFGYAPCWYLNRKKNDIVPMTILIR